VIFHKEETQPGDLLIFSWQGLPHLAIADRMEEYDCLGMIHCSLKHQKVVRHSIDGDLLSRWLYTFDIYGKILDFRLEIEDFRF
jgi:hypothetical protein